MLWEVYVALIDEHGYDIARRRMTDYCAAGLQLAPPDQTYTEMRDAILISIAAMNPTDVDIAAAAFASRGAGSCAVSPLPSASDLEGVVEDFDVQGSLRLGSITLDDDGVSCDDDHILDPGETATLRVDLANGGAGLLSSTTLAVTSATPGVTIVDAPHAIAPLAAFTTTTESFTVRLAIDAPPMALVTFEVTADDTAACEPSVIAGPW